MNLLLAATAIVLGGLIKGLNGFGYALISTSLLTLFMPPQEAIALMIIPVILANIEITAKLSIKELKACLKRFKLYIIGMFIGVTTGMVLIDYMPQTLLKKSVGLLVLLFVASRTPRLAGKFSDLKKFCVENPKLEPGLGIFSGLVFGSSNVGVPVVAYFKELDLSRDKFVSMIALTILSASFLRIPIAQRTGLYTGTDTVFLSALLGLTGLLAVETGDKLAHKLPQKVTEKASLILLVLVGFRLVL